MLFVEDNLSSSGKNGNPLKCLYIECQSKAISVTKVQPEHLSNDILKLIFQYFQ